MRGRPKRCKHRQRCMLHLWNSQHKQNLLPDVEAPPTLGEIERRRAEGEKLEEVGEVARVITYPTVGPDGCRGWAIYIRWGELARRKLQPTMGGKAPQKEFLKARKVKKPRGTSQGQWPSMRSASSKRVLTFSSTHCPSHI